ncbi:uncharacterized protein CC84DRAFT_1216135 [Paraphaeosphaeria sporulosa]|uniref:DUF924-domain-containing protein n=1 Tax=Paraphaeosphaeria sporulosa TaxID=1460663 RepID=A0A177CJW8_9PLEO|nr:uncharacterized protein CC84DRAFT_1216135 [Paraphaeosphaeria sporulosa]OAG07139.1 hypothetical protein CC84DRAFT_1216135 [Paraphaeosphaeria sporulosa]
MSTFQLDRDIFNPTLYKQVTNIWLAGADVDGKRLDDTIVKKWFSGDAELDRICNDNFAHVLDTIGPERLPEPSAKPFLHELEAMHKEDKGDGGSQAAWTALSMVILLDQMPRNIFRTNEGLKKVYTHYDRMAFDLVKSLFSASSPISRPDLHPQWQNSFAHKMWFYLPLTHSEDVKAHDILDDLVEPVSKSVEKLEGYEATKRLIEGFRTSEKSHREPLELFGRYPHRNSALSRTNTEQEQEFLKDGGATFGVAQ